MAVLSLSSIMLGIWVVPAYRQWISDSHLERKARQLLSTLKFARELAMHRKVRVTVCPSHDKQSCHGTWQDGWIVLTYIEQTRTPQVLQRQSGLYKNQRLLWKGARHVDVIQFQPLGTSIGYNGHFVLCTKGSNIAWLIFVSPTGRPRLEISRHVSFCL